MKQLFETFKGKTYQIKVRLEGFNHIKVVVMELKRPNWKCFRYSCIGTKYRLINDFDTIEDASIGVNKIWESIKYILFKDPVVEQICATNWGDGEHTPDQALSS